MDFHTTMAIFQAEIESLNACHKPDNRESFIQYVEELGELNRRNFRSQLGLAGRVLYEVCKGNKFIYPHCYAHYFELIAALVCHKGGVQNLLDRGMLVMLYNMAQYYNGYQVRKISDWKAKSPRQSDWVKEMLHFLFDRYPVPTFMEQLWYDKSAWRIRGWYIFTAQGGSIRKLPEVPIAISRKMAHKLRTLEGNYNVFQTFRVAQLQAMQAPDKLIEDILASFLGQGNPNPEFWEPIFEFLIHQYDPVLRLDIKPILDYINDNFSAEAEGQAISGKFSLRGRTLQSLQRATDAWHVSLQARRRGPMLEWEAQSIPIYIEEIDSESESESKQKFLIEELITGEALYQESAEMNHCVTSYQNKCNDGESSIWSLRHESNGEKCSLLTLEMHNSSRTLIQIRGRSNQQPEAAYMQRISDWCKAQGLKISNYAT